MPRSIWNGTITFGEIAVPIKVHSATEDRTVHFHEVHEADGARIEHRRVCSKEGKEVPYEEVVKGYEVKSGEYVVLEQDDLDAAAGDRAKLIELDEFVEAAHIDPVFYERTYYVGVHDAPDAYRLLHDALATSGKAGLGRWVFHNREYLVAVRTIGDALVLHTMRFADELVDPAKLKIDQASRKPTAKEIKMAGALVDQLHDDFDPEAFEDTYRRHVLDYLEAKRSGEAKPPLPAEPPEPSDDLVAALQASLDGAKKAA